MTTVKKWIRRLNRLAIPKVPRTERRSPSWLAALYRKDKAVAQARVKNISSSGIYLLTEERWALGELISLELQGEGLGKIDPELHLAVEARVVRHGEDGVGLCFVLPEGLDLKLWVTLVHYAFVSTRPKDILFHFRMLRAVLFICRLCRAESEEAMAVLGKEMDEARTASAMEIALGAEKLLGLKANAHTKRAHPRLVARILREGSWSTDVLSLQLWAGLLAASGDEEGVDDSNNPYVDLLIHLTPAQARILVAVCTKAMERMQGASQAPVPAIFATPKEIIQIAGTHDLNRIALDMVHLFDCGLVEERAEFSSYLPVENFRITPSALGLELFRRCWPQ